MCDGKSESVEAHSQHHVIGSVVAVALAAAFKESQHSFPAEHHPAAAPKHMHNTQSSI